jgi:enoyl-CoA hydratase/carnithine racemase
VSEQAPTLALSEQAVLYEARDSGVAVGNADAGMGIGKTSDKAEKLMHDSMQRTDFIEGITAFFEKRSPNFPPLMAKSA